MKAFCHNCYVDAGGYLEEITGFQAKLLKKGQNFAPGKKVYKGGIGELCPFLWTQQAKRRRNKIILNSLQLTSMTEQNRKYIKKVIGKLLSEILRIKGPSEQEYGQKNPVIKKLSNMDADIQGFLQ